MFFTLVLFLIERRDSYGDYGQGVDPSHYWTGGCVEGYGLPKKWWLGVLMWYEDIQYEIANIMR